MGRSIWRRIFRRRFRYEAVLDLRVESLLPGYFDHSISLIFLWPLSDFDERVGKCAEVGLGVRSRNFRNYMTCLGYFSGAKVCLLGIRKVLDTVCIW